VTLTIPAQASVSWADNTQLNFLNLGAGTLTITPAADVTINGTPLTLATSKGGSLVRTASNTWTFTSAGAGGTQSLVRVGGGALSGASTVFNSMFSATYDAYLVVVSNVVTVAATPSVALTIGAANTGYYFVGMTASYAAGTQSNNPGNNTTAFNYMLSGISSENGAGGVINIINPFLAAQTLVATTTLQSAYGGPYSGYLGNTTSYTAFTLTAVSTTFTSGTVNVYGYSLS